MSTGRGAGPALLAVSSALLALVVAAHAQAQVCSDPCTDNNVCTVNDHCSDDHCRGAALPNGTACDDGDPDTVDDVCTAAICQGIPGEAGTSDGSNDAEAVDAASQDVPVPQEAGEDCGCSAARGRASRAALAAMAGALALMGWKARRKSSRH